MLFISLIIYLVFFLFLCFLYFFVSVEYSNLLVPKGQQLGVNKM